MQERAYVTGLRAATSVTEQLQQGQPAVILSTEHVRKMRPKYRTSVTCLRICPPHVQLHSGARPVTSRTTVLSKDTSMPTTSHHKAAASMSRCKPSGAADTNQKLSAYPKSVNDKSGPTAKPSAAAAACKKRCRPSAKIPDKVGLSGQPCLTLETDSSPLKTTTRIHHHVITYRPSCCVRDRD